MSRTRLTRISITGGTAIACLAIAVPAMACTSDPSTTASSTTAISTTDLAAKQTAIEQYVTRRIQVIERTAAQVAADPTLTAAQKAAFGAESQDVINALTTLSDQVAAATTPALLKDALGQAAVLFPHLRPTSAARRVLAVKSPATPSLKTPSVKPTDTRAASSTTTVAVRTTPTTKINWTPQPHIAQHHAYVGGPATGAGRHRRH